MGVFVRRKAGPSATGRPLRSGQGTPSTAAGAPDFARASASDVLARGNKPWASVSLTRLVFRVGRSSSTGGENSPGHAPPKAMDAAGAPIENRRRKRPDGSYLLHGDAKVAQGARSRTLFQILLSWLPRPNGSGEPFPFRPCSAATLRRPIEAVPAGPFWYNGRVARDSERSLLNGFCGFRRPFGKAAAGWPVHDRGGIIRYGGRRSRAVAPRGTMTTIQRRFFLFPPENGNDEPLFLCGECFNPRGGWCGLLSAKGGLMMGTKKVGALSSPRKKAVSNIHDSK